MPPDQGFDQLGGAVALPGGIGGERQGDEIGQGFAIQVVAPSREQDAAAGGVLRQGEGEGVGQGAELLHDGGKLLAVLADGAVDGDAQPLGEDRLQIGGPALLPGRREGALSGLGLPNGLGWEGSHLNGDEIRLEGEQGTEGELIFRADAEGQHGESGAFIRQEGGFGQGALLGAVVADEQPAQSEKKAGRGQREGKGAPKIGGAGMGMFHETPPGWNRWGAGERGEAARRASRPPKGRAALGGRRPPRRRHAAGPAGRPAAAPGGPADKSMAAGGAADAKKRGNPGENANQGLTRGSEVPIIFLCPSKGGSSAPFYPKGRRPLNAAGISPKKRREAP